VLLLLLLLLPGRHDMEQRQRKQHKRKPTANAKKK